MWCMGKKENNENQRDPKSLRRLPDFAICRVKFSGMGHLTYCLVPEPDSCKHADHFGLRTFCFHPNSWKFGAGAK